MNTCNRSKTLRILALVWGVLAGAMVGAATSPVIISEFMARNRTTLADEDGAYSDWIELYNRSGQAVDLGGWYLSDNAGDPARWRLPSTNLAANAYLVVFASGKNRAVAGAPLHTDFQLDGSGEYLGLIQPDGVTVASEFVPVFPAQYDGIAYGSAGSVTSTPLLKAGAEGRFVVPTDGQWGTNWTSLAFNDAGWAAGRTGFGFDRGSTGGGGLYAYWPVREGAGTIASNLVPGGVHGQLQGATWVTNDPTRGTVLSFSGAGAHVAAGTIPRLAQTSSNFTWSFWYQQRSVLNGNAVILGNRAGGIQSPLQFVKFTPTNFEYYRDGNIGFIPYDIPTGGWRHLAVVKKGATLTYYDQGVSVGVASVGADIEANPFYWGGDPGAPGEDTDGLLDDVSLWTTALSESQVAALSAGVSPLALTGVGAAVATDLGGAMWSVAPSAYVRLPFTVEEGSAFDSLTLRVRYDDGFVASLNGVEVCRRNAPVAADWDSVATTERSAEEALRAETIELTDHLDLLEAGANVLAIHGLNRSAADLDFLVLPELEGARVSGQGDRYLAVPTPGAANDPGFLGVVGETRASHPRGFYDRPFLVTLSCGTSGAQIRYTTNGTPPSLTNGLAYTGPVPIAHTALLRAAAYLPGFETRNCAAYSYLFLDEVLIQNGAGLPAYWGSDWQMDPRVVNDPAYASRIREDMKSLPVLSVGLDPQAFWGSAGIYTQATSRGVNYEKPCSAELFFPDGSRDGFQIECGVRVVGSASRSMSPKHGLGLVFRARFGPSKLRYRFFEDSEVEDFDGLVFRPNFNMSWVRTDGSGPLNNANADGAERTHAIYVRDQFMKQSQTAMGQVGAHERFVHLYVNGVYWGLYNPSERTDASFAASYLGGEKEEYDAIFSDPSTVARAVDGDKSAWNAMMQIANAGLDTPAAYAALQQYCNVTNLADYMLLNFYGATVDWPWQNWNAARRRTADGRFHFFVWDAEYTLETPPWVPDDRTSVGPGSGESDSPAWIYHQLRQNAEWRLLFADRAHRHLFHDGALTTNQTTRRFLQACEEIDQAIVCESARWGDVVRTSQPYTRNAEWLTEKQRLLTEFFPLRSARVLNQLLAAGLYPGVAAPSFNPPGGAFTQQVTLSMTAPTGTIYYTTDGTDPRLPGGAVAPGAAVYAGPIALSASRQVQARALSAGTWSALNESVFLETAPLPLRITEIMYHPPGSTNSLEPADALQFVEIKNLGSTVFNLAGCRFSAGIRFAFPDLTLAPGQLCVIVANQAAFEARYGTQTRIAGQYEGALSHGGERLRLEGGLGEEIHDFRYPDAHPLADGRGFSLVVMDAQASQERWDNVAQWRSSTNPGGSPGVDDPTPTLPGVLINELLTHTDPPQLDSVELWNPGPAPADVSGWLLTDELGVPAKFRLPPGTVLPAGGYRVFTEADFNPTPGVGTSFGLSSIGDEVWLFSADADTNLTGYLHGCRVPASANGDTFGRYVNSVGEEQFPTQSASSLGATNAGPRIGPVVINEIHYHPLWGEAEFVELQNVSATNVALFDPAHPENTWRLGGLAYSLPTNLSLPPDGLLLLTRVDPASFRTQYAVPAAVPILGGVFGALQDDGETLELQRPDNPNTNGVPYLVVDAVHYRDSAPWPVEADGGGASLQRRVANAYGSDPANWFAAAITPGLPNRDPHVPTFLTLVWTAEGLQVSWPSDVVGAVLEAAEDLPAAGWVPVGGVSGNRVTVLPATGSRFYRLRLP